MKIVGWDDYFWSGERIIILKFKKSGRFQRLCTWLFFKLWPPVVSIDFPKDDYDDPEDFIYKHSARIRRDRKMNLTEILKENRRNMRL